MESHGGYAYCGVAALAILNRLDVIDCDALLVRGVMCSVVRRVRLCTAVKCY